LSIIPITQLIGYIGCLKATIDLIRFISTKYKSRPKFVELDDLLEGCIDFGKDIRVEGTFSEYVPATEPIGTKIDLKKHFMVPSLPLRYHEINKMRCSTLQFEEYNNPIKRSLPIFYSWDIPRPIGDLTAEKVMIKGKTVNIPSKWMEILDIDSPTGIKANTIEPLNEKKSQFYTPVWAVLRSKMPRKSDKLEGSLWESENFFYARISMISGQTNCERKLLILGDSVKTMHFGYDIRKEVTLANVCDETKFSNHKDFLKNRILNFQKQGFEIEYIYDYQWM